MIPELSNAGVPQAQVDLLAGYFADASARLRLAVQHPAGRTDGSREFRQARAAELIGQVDAVLLQLNRQSAAWVGKSMTEAYRQGVARADRQATDAGVRVPDSGLRGSFAAIDLGTASVFARDAYADLAGAADSMGATARKLLRATAQLGLAEADINRILAGGAIEGAPRQTIATLRDELIRVNGGATVTIINKNGEPMHFAAGDYASRVVRTKTREATVFSRHERLGELGIDLVAIIGRVSATFCTAFLGGVFSLSGRDATHPALSQLPGGGPPFHVNCSKSTRPYVAQLAGETQRRQASLLPDSGRLLGLDPSAAQKAYAGLQIRQQVSKRYATTAAALFGRAA